MAKQLRFDLYKIIRSPIMWAIFALSGVFLLKDPIVDFIVKRNSYVAALAMLDIRHYFVLCVIFFVVALVAEDYSSGYYKSIAPSINKVYYVFSKVIYIIAFTGIWLSLYLLLMLIFCKVFAGGVINWYVPPPTIYDSANTYTMDTMYAPLLILWLSALAYGLLVMALCFATKNVIAALLIPVILLFAGQFIELWLDQKILDLRFALGKPTPDSYYITDYYSVFPECIMDDWECWRFTDREIRISAGLLSGYSVLAVGISLLFCCFRKKKN